MASSGVFGVTDSEFDVRFPEIKDGRQILCMRIWKTIVKSKNQAQFWQSEVFRVTDSEYSVKFSEIQDGGPILCMRIWKIVKLRNWASSTLGFSGALLPRSNDVDVVDFCSLCGA